MEIVMSCYVWCNVIVMVMSPGSTRNTYSNCSSSPEVLWVQVGDIDRIYWHNKFIPFFESTIFQIGKIKPFDSRDHFKKFQFYDSCLFRKKEKKKSLIFACSGRKKRNHWYLSVQERKKEIIEICLFRKEKKK